jgi:lipopolysaccharide/colanic/teichoic acid biosynthesis glycosyltransferase
MPINNIPKVYLLKRPFDFSLALIGLTLIFPIWSLIVFLVWLEGDRPIFYVQERVGKNGALFKTVKFRTMGYRKKSSILAKFLRTTALDELPQLINIIKGQMSFVGPRPLIPQELQISEEFKLRSAVLPGLTGLAQVLVAKDAPVLEKLNYDIVYIKNQNIALDILLILRSFGISLNRKWDTLNNGLKMNL